MLGPARNWLALVGFTLLASQALAAETDSRPVAFGFDRTHSTIMFVVTHYGLYLIKGEFHEFDGRLDIDPRHPERAAVSVTIHTASVDTARQHVDTHLRAPDFFHVKRFPTMTFQSKQVEVTGSRTGRVEGDVTLLGITRPLVLDVTLDPLERPGEEPPQTARFSATAVLTRSEFGMDWGPDWFAQDVEILIEVEARRL